ncbi:MAG TPA: hypothetical protein VE134_07670 [Methanomicrobiales archaeon]|nr:hypothetical protein [Methanomicrobiales archaeon]
MNCGTLCSTTFENQAAYIAGWLQHIQNGSAADIIRAAVDAQRAADYLTGGGEDPAPSSRDRGRARLFAHRFTSETRPSFLSVSLMLQTPPLAHVLASWRLLRHAARTAPPEPCSRLRV